MVEELHWVTRVMSLLWAVFVTGYTPAPAQTPRQQAAMAQAASAQATAQATQCTSAHECTVVRDHCGRPYGRPLTNPVAPPGPGLCPPASYAITEPGCENGVCEAVVATNAALRDCSRDRDCMAIEWVCGGWWAVARSERQAAAQYVQEMGRNRSCRAPTPTQAPRVECLERVCVTRARP